MITPISQWPTWLEYLIFGPHALLVGVLMWWWPKNDRQWRRFGLLLGYLIVFYGVMYFVFGFR